jgi:hypothetical protein
VKGRVTHFVVLALAAGCTTLTKVDWSRIPAPQGNGGAGGSTSNGGSAGGAPVTQEGGQGGVESRGAGAAGQSDGGEAGAAGESSGGSDASGGTGGGGATSTAGGGNVGTGGTAGSAGTAGSGGGTAIAPKCNKYPVTPVSVDLAGKIVLFDAGPVAAGTDWGGRDGLDAKCQGAAGSLGLNKPVIHALLSATTDDMLTPGIWGNYVERFAVPTVPPVVSQLGFKIADSAGEITNFKTSLICAGVVHEDVEAWLTGVKDGGVSDPLVSCSGWTLRKEDLNVRASVGLTDTTNTLFHDNLLADHWVSCNNSTAHLLCLGWDE